MILSIRISSYKVTTFEVFLSIRNFLRTRVMRFLIFLAFGTDWPISFLLDSFCFFIDLNFLLISLSDMHSLTVPKISRIQSIDAQCNLSAHSYVKTYFFKFNIDFPSSLFSKYLNIMNHSKYFIDFADLWGGPQFLSVALNSFFFWWALVQSLLQTHLFRIGMARFSILFERLEFAHLVIRLRWFDNSALFLVTE